MRTVQSILLWIRYVKKEGLQMLKLTNPVFQSILLWIRYVKKCFIWKDKEKVFVSIHLTVDQVR